VYGLLLGVGFGVIVGFVSFAIMEKLTPSASFVIFAPSGLLRVGIFGGLLMGLVGGVLGLITGAFGLRAFQAAAVGALLFVVLKLRNVYRGMRMTMNMAEVSLVFDFALIGALVALSLPRIGF
jgi:hypothetical protein